MRLYILSMVIKVRRHPVFRWDTYLCTDVVNFYTIASGVVETLSRYLCADVCSSHGGLSANLTLHAWLENYLH